MGWFDSITSAITGAFNSVSSAISSAVSTASRTIGGSVSAAISAGRSYTNNAAQTLASITASIPKVAGYTPPSFAGMDLAKTPQRTIDAILEAARSQAAAAQNAANSTIKGLAGGVQATEQTAARLLEATKTYASDPVRLAAETATITGKTVAEAEQAARVAYLKAQGLSGAAAQVAIKAISSGASSLAKDAASIARNASVNVIGLPSQVAAAAKAVTLPAATAAVKTVSQAVKTATAAPAAASNLVSTSNDVLASTYKAATTAVSAPISASKAVAVSLNNTITKSLPAALSGGGSVVVNSAGSIPVSISKLLDQGINLRDNSYEVGGETFAEGWEKGDAVKAGTGAALYSTVSGLDFLLPTDALNVGNKLVTGRGNELTSEDYFYAAGDVATLAGSAFTGGVGYAAARAAIKGIKEAKAIKGSKAALKGGLYAGEQMAIKLKVPKTIKTVAKAATKTATKAAAKVKTVVKKAPTVKKVTTVKKTTPVKTKPVAKVSKPAVSTTSKAAKATTTVKTAEKTKTVKATTPTTIKSTAKTTKATAPTTVKEKVKSTKAATVEETQKTAKASSSSLVGKALTFGVPAALIGTGLATYALSGSGDTVTDPNQPGGGDQPTVEQGTGEEWGDTIGGEDAPMDEGQNDALNDQIAQAQEAADNGEITQEEADTIKDEAADQIDDAGGYFDAAIGSDTPYQSVEDAAQDVTRAIPGDPLEWFRQNGLAAPAVAGIALLLILVIWYVWKRFKKGHKAGSGSHGRKGSGTSGGSGSGNKIVVV